MNHSVPATPHIRPRSRFARRGSVYVLVLGTAVMLSLTGLSVVALTRVFIARQTTSRSSNQATEAAVSGLHAMLAYINTSATWRDEFSKGNYPDSMQFGTAEVKCWGEDYAGGLVSTDPTRRVKLVAVATCGQAVRAMTVEAAPPTAAGPLDALSCAIHAAGDISVSGGQASGGPVSSDTKINISGTVTSNFEAPLVVNAGAVTGTITTSSPTKPLPTATETLFLSRSLLMSWDAVVGNFDSRYLSSHTAWGGGVSSTGIYAINVPAGVELIISRSRIAALLLVQLNAGSKLTIRSRVSWHPPSPALPSLVVYGSPTASVFFEGTTLDLSETEAWMNFNTSNFPYLGESDNDKSDTYPGVLCGVFDIQDGIPVTIKNTQRIHGCVLASGPVNMEGGRLTADPLLTVSPPEGYTGMARTMTAITGTWKRVSPDSVSRP